MHRLDPLQPPRFDHWPEAVRSAELMRGSLVRCGPGVRSVGWPDSLRTRAAALRGRIDDDHAAIRSTAAWVWGAIRLPGPVLELTTVGGRRARQNDSRLLKVSQLSLVTGDLCEIDGLATTSPVRTAVDLLRHTEGFGPRERAIVRLLAARHSDGLAAVRARLIRGGHNFRRRALQRLDEL